MAFTYGTVTNATCVGHGTRKEYEVRLGYQVNSQSVEKNTSNITLRLEVRSINSSYNTYGVYQTTTLDGVTLSKAQFNMSATNTWQIFGSRTYDITHNSDGSYSATKSGSFTSEANFDWGLKSGSASVTVSPAKIPRASSVACSSPYIGDTATITISKKVSSFTHNVTYHILDYDTLTGTIADNTKETVLSFDTSTLKEQIYALMPNAKSIAATIRCRTYSGSTKIGDTAIANFNLYAKEDECKPLLTLGVTDTNEKVTEVVGSNEKFIKYISRPKVVMYPTPRYSATIKGHTISLGDGQYYYAESHTFDTMASNVVSGTVRDSRDYYTTTTKEVEMIDYIKLHIDKVSIERTEQLSSEVVLNANGVWFNGYFIDGEEESKNGLVTSFYYKLSGDTEWTQLDAVAPIIEGNTFKFTDVSLGNIYDYNNEYQFKIILSDVLMTVGSEDKESITVPKGQEVVAIGEDSVWIYGNLLLNDNPIIESGNNENGSWTKWADGTMMCIKHVTGVTPVNRAWGSLYESLDVPLGDYSQPFIEIPIVSATISIPYGESGNGLFIEWIKDKSKTSYGSAIFVRPNESDGATYQVDLTAKGRWK